MSITRRGFVKGSLAATAMGIFTGPTARVRGANDSVGAALISCGGRSGDLMTWIREEVSTSRLVAVSDPDAQAMARRADGAQKAWMAPVDQVADFRRVLDRKDVDVVFVSTPNHWHSLAAIWAVQAGKDVYVEKPVSHNVWEGRQLVNAARRYGRIVQTGTQSRSSTGLKEFVAYLRSGEMGRIEKIVATCFKARGPIGKLDKPLVIPPHIDYDLWCGPAAKVDLYRPSLHYDWHWDYNTGNGDLGNQGIHQMDLARWFLGVGELSPRVTSIGGRLGYDDAGNTPNTQIVYHDYKEAPIIFEVRGLPRTAAQRKVGWGNNDQDMDNYLGARIGVVVHCEKAFAVVPSYANANVFANEDREALLLNLKDPSLAKRPKPVKSFSGGGPHVENFIHAVGTRKAQDLNADVLEGHLSSALCHTGNISYQLGSATDAPGIAKSIQANPAASESWGRMLEHLRLNEVDIAGGGVRLGPWLTMDPKSERFLANDPANALLTRPYRKGFEVPEIKLA